MFGHDNQHHHEENNLPQPDGALTDAVTTASPQVGSDDNAGAYIDDVPSVTAPTTDDPTATDDVAVPDTVSPTPEPADITPVAPAAVEPATPAPSVAAPDADKLLDIKQQALQQLTPLVGHLEQSPEEKFRTTMMMIQASDNHELVSAAYEAAQQIPDEKVRAQALLDIVNEINYFTHSGTEA
jgi:hypothetical protein